MNNIQRMHYSFLGLDNGQCTYLCYLTRPLQHHEDGQIHWFHPYFYRHGDSLEKDESFAQGHTAGGGGTAQLDNGVWDGSPCPQAPGGALIPKCKTQEWLPDTLHNTCCLSNSHSQQEFSEVVWAWVLGQNWIQPGSAASQLWTWDLLNDSVSLPVK